MQKNNLNVLLVDDDEDDYLITEELLQDACKGVRIVWANNYKQAISFMEKETFDIFLFDYYLGPDSGLDLTRWVATRDLQTPVILLTGMDNRDLDLEAMHSGVTDYLVKQDLNPHILERSIRYAIRQKTDELKLLELAHYDPLTKLANRTYFNQMLHRSLQNSSRLKSNFAILTLDLDHFKNINDTLGHDAGDELLIASANILRQCCRNTDTIARLGGDEFTIIATHLNDKEGSTCLAKKIIERFIKPIEINGQAINIGVSVGISLYPFDATKHEELIRLSDKALYQAKNSGRNTFCFYDETLNREAHEQALLQNQISRGIVEKHFQLYYQPVVEINTGHPMYVEALMRWDHPESGFIPPDKFIPIMELSPTIITMGEWAINEAARQHALWIEQGLPPMSIAVNVSAKQFSSSSLVETIKKVILNYQLAPSFLTLELTESVLMPTQQVLNTLKELQQTGIKISIDDFGTGYSSLAYLKRFDVNTLKIDREFIKELPHNEEDSAITSAIIALGKALSLEIVAEGIETNDQLELLKIKQCDFAQGYLFSKPLPPNEFVDWYKEAINKSTDNKNQ